jgi:hypothetical protein
MADEAELQAIREEIDGMAKSDDSRGRMLAGIFVGDEVDELSERLAARGVRNEDVDKMVSDLAAARWVRAFSEDDIERAFSEEVEAWDL